MESSKSNFRIDINGLRAWAVIAVVLYHFEIPGITGGFAGVDVFFVISGYLMFGIIASGLQRGDYSIWRFYLARARRIWPALVVLCASTLVFGWFLLMPKEYQQLGGQVRESLVFTSNFRFLGEAGYFDVESKEKWLLHTWSLSVEWQFYLILPLILAFAWRLCPRPIALHASIVILFLASLVYCLLHTPQAQSEAFFLLQFRAWEMLAGALAYQISPHLTWQNPLKRISEFVGFLLIILSIGLFDPYVSWPGWRATLPVLGAVLILLAARQNSPFTASKPAQWLGTRSYSIYLWHWPVVVALAYAGILDHSGWVWFGIALSLLLGHLSYTLVEMPASKMLGAIGAKRAAMILVAAIVIIAVAAQVVRRSGVPERLSESVAWIEAERENQNPRLKECLAPDASCVYGEQPIQAILIGDSHADAVVTALQASLPQGKGGVLFRGASGCPIVFGMKSSDQGCQSLNEELQQTHRTLPQAPIVVVGRTSNYINAGTPGGKAHLYFGEPTARVTQELLNEFSTQYVKTLCELAEHRPVYLVRPIPEMTVDVPTISGRSLLFGQQQNVTLPREDYERRQAFITGLQDEAANRCGVKILDPTEFLCDDSVCYGNDDKKMPYYRDKDHLSEYGNKVLVPMFERVFR